MSDSGTQTAAPAAHAPPAASAAVRRRLVEALRLDLIGPAPSDAARQCERLEHAPSRWYLTGFLVPAGAREQERAQDGGEEIDEPAEQPHGSDDAATPDRGSGKRMHLPSSMGLSVLVEPETKRLEVTVTWGDYAPETEEDESNGDAVWARAPRAETVFIDLATLPRGTNDERAVPNGGGACLACLARPTHLRTAAGDRPALAVSLFLVNRRPPADEEDRRDAAFMFQAEMTVEADRPFVPRHDPHGLDSTNDDERIADLHYRDVADYAAGHNVSVRAESTDECRRVATEWLPQAIVDRVEPGWLQGVELEMEVLGALPGAAEAEAALAPLPAQYRSWIAGETRRAVGGLTGPRREIARELTARASRAADRIEAGIRMLADPDILESFRIANRAMAAAARRREAVAGGTRPEDAGPPAWRPFQLAYILMNLRGIADPAHAEREVVDLLFFPTGGGKTEAYLGLAALALALRRLRNPYPAWRGLSVLMRYTLRLLTLDQLGRAAALICALEMERENAPDTLGEWPFEIALWVGRAATPNRMGVKGDGANDTARAKTLRFKRDSSREPPLPIRQCPWCGTRFDKNSFELSPNADAPNDLLVSCANRRCDFAARKRRLPIVAVDEPIYRRVPAFMVATADKFAALPWTGETAKFFGGESDNRLPPDLIIQDELHLISGPLGSMAGLYETAIDGLCTQRAGGKPIRPKIVASTATVRLAEKQIRALFDRETVEIFPPPGIDRRDSFFARQARGDKARARLYLGVAAPGRGPKVVFLRTAITLMAAAQAAWETAGGERSRSNPADPYMTAVAYFNALRELGSARRIVEDEIGARLQRYSLRKRIGETDCLFADRTIAVDPVELTSRVGTASVAEARRRMALGFREKERVDVALATNMISVGLDIVRLGLMIVSGQPKTASEYIQATSRVGRDPERPGLVVALLNLNKPRDRSHYERFSAWHESFYRGVEAASVTPFSPRALDRGLPAVAVALARLGIPELTPMRAAAHIGNHGNAVRDIAEAIGGRAQRHARGLANDFGDLVRDRVTALADDWSALAREAGQGGVSFGYARAAGIAAPLLREIIDPDRDTLTEPQLRFRAPRSLRDVEPGALLGIKTPEGKDIREGPK